MSLLRKMWFGTKQFSRWIKVQSPDSTPGMGGSSERLDFGNGGVAIRDSINGHMEYALSWNRLTQREAQEITDFAYGLYGSDLLYLSEPSSIQQNVLNKAWSAPGLTAKDGIPLAGDVRPEIVKNFDQSQGYPVDMAKYQIGDSTPRRSFYVPIPPGHTAWVGAHGDTSSTGGMTVQPTVRGDASGAPKLLPLLGVNTAQRFNGSFSASGEQAGLELALEPNSPVTNLLTNSSAEAAGATVEVRRNFFRDPQITNPSFWGVVGGTAVFAGNYVAITATGTSSGNMLTPALTSWFTALSNVAVSCSWKVENIGSVPFTVEPRFWDGAVYATGDAVTIPAGETRVVKNENKIMTGAYAQPRLWQISPTVGASVRVSEPMIEAASVVGSYFDPVAGSGDVDLTASWESTANNSPVLLTGLSIAGVSAIGCFAIRSSRWAKSGSYSMRLIPNSDASNSSRAQIAIPTGAVRTLGTAHGTVHLESPLTGTINAFALAVRVQSPVQSIAAPNQVGDAELRLTFSDLASSPTLQFWHGGALGSGDVWWDCLGLFEGEYDGGWFDGSTTGATWNGTPNASTSTLASRTTTLAGIMVQVLQTGETPADGPYISGQGAGGLQFEGRVQAVPYSLAHDSVGLSVKLVETEDWK